MTNKTQQVLQWLQTQSNSRTAQDLFVLKAQEIFEADGNRFYPHSFLHYVVSKGYVTREHSLIIFNSATPIHSVQDYNVSVGIEFEGNAINHQGKLAFTSIRDRYARVNKFDYQPDGTATFEIVSRPYTDLNVLAHDSSEQWAHWMASNSAIPFFQCDVRHPSIGHHIHVGLINRRLKANEKKQVATAVSNILPFTLALSVNSPSKQNKCLSNRARTSCFCEALSVSAIGGSHYCEISDSNHGTVEVRSFDANIPQVAITNACLIQNATKTTLAGKTFGFDSISYREERAKVINDGVKALNIRETKQKLLTVCGDIDFSKYPSCVKEILYLAITEKTTVLEFSKHFNKVAYAMAMSSMSDKFFDALLSIAKKETIKKKLTKMITAVSTITKLSEIPTQKTKLKEDETRKEVLRLLKLSVSVSNIRTIMSNDYDYSNTIVNKIEKLLNCKNTRAANKVALAGKEEFYVFNSNLIKLKEKQTKIAIKTSAQVLRIKQANDMHINVVEAIGKIYAQHNANVTAQQIIEAKQRYYVMLANQEIVAFVAVDVPNQVIVDIKIDNKYLNLAKSIVRQFKKFVKTNHHITEINLMEANPCVA